ncbi:MAG: HD domain-containing protein, partial [Fibromonadales bacterium]|nr:HD domain-containing protein [Fibromonadales bacterium]
MLFLGTSQIVGKKQRSSLNWYFFAICVVIAISTLNNSVMFYTAFTENVALGESSYTFTKLNMVLSIIKVMIVPFLFSFIHILSKIKSNGIRILQHVLLSVNALVVSAIFIIIAASINAFSFLSSYLFNTSVLLMVLFSLGCLIFLQYKWIKSASLKRDRSQAKTILIGSLIALVSLSFDLAASHSHYFYNWIELIPFMWLVVLAFVLNNYANQYNNFSFNAANLAKYVYTAVKLPVLILDETGDIMLCNTASESFFKKNTEQLTNLKLFDLFDFAEDISFSSHRNKKDASVFNCDAVCLVEGQKCQVSLNYVYDKFDEMICTVVIVTDITEKEDLIRQLNESHAQIESFNKELQSEVDRQTESIRNLQKAIVYSMSDLIEKKDGFTGEHTRRVSEYVAILLREMVRRGYKLTESEIQKIAESSLLHDMGKIAIPDNILLKNGKLTDDEFEAMKNHSTTGADSLQKSMQFA